MKFYQSEASVAAMGQNFFEMELDKVIGLAYWGAIDYLGESQGWPAKGWSQGVFTIDLETKPKAYYMKSFFKPDEPVVHIAVIDKKGDQMWNGVQTGNDGMSDHWNRVEGQKLQLITYTNAEEVELLLNGKSLGKKQNDLKNAKMRNQIRWNEIVYRHGKLEAIARTGGKIVARHQIETTGEAVRLSAECLEFGDVSPAKKSKTSTLNPQPWQADGMDLQHVRIVAVDKKGRRVPMANQEVTFNVEGAASIVGVVNGDINSNEILTGNRRSLFNGACTVILRSTREAGPVTLTATAPGLKPVAVKMSTTR
jgi:beta-galactosidase